MSQTRGMAYLRRKLELKRSRVLTRYKYYEMKNAVKDFGMVTPPEFRTFSEVLGWCGKAVDSLADRLIFREFRHFFHHFLHAVLAEVGDACTQRLPNAAEVDRLAHRN